jgi:aspartate aminotransferase
MISLRSKKQITSDVTNFFKDFREYDYVENNYNLGLGEIVCRNRLLEELEQYSDIITKRITKYACFYPGCQGYKPLNEKLAELIKLETNEEVSADEIVLTSGAYDAITQAAFTYADYGDKIMYPVPSFPYWSNASRALSGNKQISCPSQEIFTNSLGDLFEANLDKSVSLFILNNPHNPLGAFLSKAQALKINEIAQKNNVKVVLDDVYRAFSARKWIGHYFDLDNTIIVDSLSKRFGMPGLKIGFVRVPKDDLPFFRASVANQYVGVSLVSAVLADIVLTLYLNDRSLNNIPGEMARRQEKLDAVLTKISNLNSPRPSGGMFRIIYCSDSINACNRLLENNIRVTSGKACLPVNFSQGNEFIRLSVGGEPKIKEAAEKLVEVIEKKGDIFFPEIPEQEEIVVSP